MRNGVEMEVLPIITTGSGFWDIPG